MLRTSSPRQTREAGRAFGRHAPEGAIVLLAGSLGAGKTTFAQGVAEGCGVSGPVASPTYNLILHHAGDRPFTHVDLYRLGDVSELETLDLDEILSAEGVTCVEWPGPIADLAPPPRAHVRLDRQPDESRTVSIALEGEGWERVREALEGGGAA